MIRAEVQIRKAEEPMVHPDQLVAEKDAADAAEDGARRDHDEGELEIMQDDMAVGKAKGLQNGDLFPLQGEQSREHGIDHERGDAQKHKGEADGERFQHPDLIRNPHMRGVVGSAERAPAAVGPEQTVDFRNDRALSGAGCQGKREVVEGAVEVKSRCQLLIGHPEGAIGAVVREGGAGARLENKLRGEHDADDAQLLAFAIEQDGDGIAGKQVVGGRKGLAGQDLTPVVVGEPAARAEEQAVELGGARVRQRAHHAAGRFLQRGNVERYLDGDARLDRRYAGDVGEARGERVGRPFEHGEHLREAIRLVIFRPRGFERVNEAAGHDHHRQTASHDQRNGDGLPFDAAQVTGQFAVQQGDHGVTNSGCWRERDADSGGCAAPVRRKCAGPDPPCPP